MTEAKGEIKSHNLLEVPIAMVGSWAHPEYGKVEFTDSDLDAAITNFGSGSLGFEPHLTFGHLDEEPASTDSHRKRGDLKYLLKDDGVLKGYFDVSPTTQQAVVNSEYEYSSGEFIRNLMDKTTGEYKGMGITRVALTNTPYLPWGEEGKVRLVQMLSQTGGNTLTDVVTSVMKLSTGAPSMTLETAPTVPVPSDLNPTIINTSPAAPASPPVVTTTPPSSRGISDHSALDIEALTSSIMAQVTKQMKEEQDRLKAENDTKVSEANKLVADVQGEMAALKERLAKAESDASLYTSHSSKAAQEQELQQLMSMGLSAVAANKYTAIKQALDTKATVVKLSQAGTADRELPLAETIRELVMDALRQTPVMTTQMGLAGNPSDGDTGVMGYLKNAISESKQRKANPPATRVSI